MSDRDELIDLVCALAEHLDGRRWDRFAEVLTPEASAYGIGGGPDAIVAAPKRPDLPSMMTDIAMAPSR